MDMDLNELDIVLALHSPFPRDLALTIELDFLFNDCRKGDEFPMHCTFGKLSIVNSRLFPALTQSHDPVLPKYTA